MFMLMAGQDSEEETEHDWDPGFEIPPSNIISAFLILSYP